VAWWHGDADADADAGDGVKGRKLDLKHAPCSEWTALPLTGPVSRLVASA
jgi:hypothetical protein